MKLRKEKILQNHYYVCLKILAQKLIKIINLFEHEKKINLKFKVKILICIFEKKKSFFH